MDLRTYLSQPGKTASALARTIGVSHSTILRLASGEIKPAFDTLQKLHTATDGAVSPNDFLAPATETALASVAAAQSEVRLQTS